MRNARTHAQIKDTIGLYTQQLIDFFPSSFVSLFFSNPEQKRGRNNNSIGLQTERAIDMQQQQQEQQQL